MEYRQELLIDISEYSKAATGSRSRKDYSGYSIVELEAERDFFGKWAAETAKEEEKAEAAALAKWEAELAAIMESGASSREQAIKWHAQSLGDASDFEYFQLDPGYYCYQCGLPYGMATEVKAAFAA